MRNSLTLAMPGADTSMYTPGLPLANTGEPAIAVVQLVETRRGTNTPGDHRALLVSDVRRTLPRYPVGQTDLPGVYEGICQLSSNVAKCTD